MSRIAWFPRIPGEKAEAAFDALHWDRARDWIRTQWDPSSATDWNISYGDGDRSCSRMPF